MAKKCGSSAPADFGMSFFGDEDTQDLFAIKEFLHTGSYNFNRILSGSLFKGIPEKRVLALIGEEAVGKSLFALTMAREAQKKDWLVAYFDTENALSIEFAKAVGLDSKKLLYKQVVSIEDFRRTALKLIEWKSNQFGKEKKLLIVLDSYGGLMAKKFLDDIDDGKDTSDMGLGAKVAKATFKMIGAAMAPHNVTFVYTNHIYMDNSGYVPVAQQTGGTAAKYYPSIVVMLKKKIVRDEDKKATGVNIIAQTTKSRVVPPYQTAEIYLDWHNGLDPYAGIIDIMIEFNMIKNASGWYTIEGDTNKHRWDGLVAEVKGRPELLEQLELKIQETGYKTIQPITEEGFVVAAEKITE